MTNYTEIFDEIANSPHEPAKVEIRLQKLQEFGNMSRQSAVIIEEAYREAIKRSTTMLGEIVDGLSEPLRKEGARYIVVGLGSLMQQTSELLRPMSLDAVLREALGGDVSVLALLLEELKNAPEPLKDGATPGCDCVACTIARAAGVGDRTTH